MKRRELVELIHTLERLERKHNLTGDGYLWLQDLKRSRDGATTTDPRGPR